MGNPQSAKAPSGLHKIGYKPSVDRKLLRSLRDEYLSK